MPAPAKAPLKSILPIPLNNDTIPLKMNSNTATINAMTPMIIHQPIGLNKQANSKIPITIKKFFICQFV